MSVHHADREHDHAFEHAEAGLGDSSLTYATLMRAQQRWMGVPIPHSKERPQGKVL